MANEHQAIRDFKEGLDLGRPVCHVALFLDAGAGAPVSITSMVASYKHAITQDFERLRRSEGRETDADAIEFLIRRAVQELSRRGKKGKGQLIEEDGGWRFADGVAFDDGSLLWGGQKDR